LILNAAGLALLLLDSAGCSGSTSDPSPDNSNDAAVAPDTSGNVQHPPPSQDAGPDGTIQDGGADAPSQDAPSQDATDGGASDGSTTDSGDSGPNCAAILAQMMSAPIAPPNRWAGLDLAKGGAADGGPSGGGLTIDEAAILGCAQAVEPDTFDGGTAPGLPGARQAVFGTPLDGGTAPVTVAYNPDSRVIWQVALSAPSTSTLTFHARAGGAYDHGGPDGGTSVYTAGFGADGVGYMRKDGVDFPPDWNVVRGDAGHGHASAWANEIYDGLMATFAPSEPAVADCLETPFDRFFVPKRVSACFFGSNILGARPLGIYLVFTPANQLQIAYEFWPGGTPSCATPRAALENVEYGGISLDWNLNGALGPKWAGTNFGPLVPAEPVANPAGLLATEANTLAGCTAVPVPAPDPGYAAEQWGHGELQLEYNATSNVTYKVFANAGYPSPLEITTTPVTDGGAANDYIIQPGKLMLNGAPLTLDWSSADAGGDAGSALNAVITDISNGWNLCTTDDDCVLEGDCTIVPDDGQGHSSFTLMTAPANVQGGCPDQHPLTVVFPKGSSVPSQIIATNPGGQ
jgi:hypothetical protein